MKRNSIPVVLAALILPAVFAGCATKGPAPVALFPEYVLANSAEQSQTKSAVTITVSPLGPSGMYDHPELFSFKKDDLAEPIGGQPCFLTYYSKDYQDQYWCYTFGVADQDLAVFSVSIENGTDHILRMKDARLYLEVEGHDPIAAVTKAWRSDPRCLHHPVAHGHPEERGGCGREPHPLGDEVGVRCGESPAEAHPARRPLQNPHRPPEPGHPAEPAGVPAHR